MYIDIHNHGLYGVDDGAQTMEESLALLQEAKRQQVSAIVFTPHYRHGMFAYSLERINAHYQKLKEVAEEIGIDIYLGCEYHVDSRMEEAFREERCHTLADGDYVLTEYSGQSEYSDMLKYTKQMLMSGYIPVIAHVERYNCLVKDPKKCLELSDMGAKIQVNAGCVLGLEGRIAQKFAKKLLKYEVADIIASDTHDLRERTNHMEECYEYVARKYGETYANRLFIRNPRKILHAQED